MQKKYTKNIVANVEQNTIECVNTGDITIVSHERIHLESSNILPIANSLV